MMTGRQMPPTGKPFTNQVRFDFPRKRSGHGAFKMRFSRPGMTLERFLRKTAEALRYALLDAHRFIGMVFGSRPNLSSTAVFVNPAASTVT